MTRERSEAARSKLHIAGRSVALHETERALRDLDLVYREFEERGVAYSKSKSNPHLCFAGCSHCCRQGAFFAVTLIEAFRWVQAVEALHPTMRDAMRAQAEKVLGEQQRLFQGPGEAPDVPGQRDEALFSARVARVAATGVGCPLLEGDLCSVYDGRPFLCRAYGYPADAYAVEKDTSITFRSLCHLYADKELHDYVRSRDLKRRLGELSSQLAGGADLGRFTSAEAILARVEPATDCETR